MGGSLENGASSMGPPDLTETTPTIATVLNLTLIVTGVATSGRFGDSGQVALFAYPMTIADANAFVSQYHRHHQPMPGCKFSIGVVKDGTLVGVAMAGRPVSRSLDDGRVLEVNRVCTDGTRNACSFLYGCVARAAFAMGYAKVITYVLPEEGGASLRASGWKHELRSMGGAWSTKKYKRNDHTRPLGPKDRYAIENPKALPADMVVCPMEGNNEELPLLSGFG